VSSNNIGKKQIAINMLANIVSYSANIIISFVLTPFLINSLGKETYSFYPIANTIVSYMSVLMNAMNSMASRFVTVAIVKKRSDEANKYFASTLAANLIFSAILLVPMALIVIFLDKFMDVPINSKASIKALFALVFSSAIINISASVFGIATFAKNRIDLRSLRELVTASIRLALFFVLYRFLPSSIIYVGIVAVIVAVVNMVFQVVYTKILLGEINFSLCYVSLKHTKELLGSSSWNAINTFGNTLLAGMSMILANIFYGAEAAGSYSIVNTVPQFICGIIVMLVGVFYPVITYKYAQDDKKGLIKELKTAQSMVGIVGCSVISVFSALATEFFLLWTPNENAYFLSVLSFFTIIPHFFIACMWPLTNMNVVLNKVRIPALYTLGCGLANVAMAFISYRIWAPGVLSLPIISSFLQVIWIGLLIPQYVVKNLQLPWNAFYSVLLKAIVCSGIIMISVLKIKKAIIINSWLKLLLFGGICGFIALLFFSIVLIGKNDLKRILMTVLEKIIKIGK